MSLCHKILLKDLRRTPVKTGKFFYIELVHLMCPLFSFFEYLNIDSSPGLMAKHLLG